MLAVQAGFKPASADVQSTGLRLKRPGQKLLARLFPVLVGRVLAISDSRQPELRFLFEFPGEVGDDASAVALFECFELSVHDVVMFYRRLLLVRASRGTELSLGLVLVPVRRVHRSEGSLHIL